MYYQHNLKDDVLRFKQACDWFEERGFDYSRTRYRVYEKKLDFSNVEYTLKDILGLKNAYLEMTDFIKIYENLKNIEFDNWSNQANFIFKGGEFINSTDKARDYLFELYIASKFHQAKYSVELNKVTDIVATKGLKKYLIECKKVKSKNLIYKNIKKAAKQIHERSQNQMDRGFIFIDLSTLLEGGHLFSETPIENTFKLKEKMSIFLESVITSKEVKDFITNPIYKNVLGIFFYTRCFSIVTGENAGFMYTANTSIIPLSRDVQEVASQIFHQDI